MRVDKIEMIKQLIVILLWYFVFRLLHISSLLQWLFKILLPVLIAFLFRIILDPIIDSFHHINRKIVCVILYALIFIVVLVLLYLSLPSMIQQCMELYSNYDMDHLENYLHPFFQPAYHMLENFNLIEVIVHYLQSFTSSMLFWLSNIMIGYGISFYLVYDHVTICGLLKRFRVSDETIDLMHRLKEITQSFLKANVIDFMVFFLCGFAVFCFIGLDYAFYLALFIAATNLISYIGPYIGGIPIIIYAYFTNVMIGNMTTAAIIVMQLLESNILQPILFKKCIAVNPILLIVALSIFGDLFGIVGMILAPLILAYMREIGKLLEHRFFLKKEVK